jgi:hypothetical protein
VVRSLLLAPLLAVVLAGCFGGSKPTAADTRRAESPATESEVTAATCPVTLPNESVPPDATDWPRDDSHGNGKLWTYLGPYGVVVAPDEYIEKDGSIRVKWPWWRGVRGKLKVEGRRLDRPARPLRAEINNGYGLSGFQPSGIYFSTEGCWEVTGKVGGASLTFVTVVVKASTYALELKTE